MKKAALYLAKLISEVEAYSVQLKRSETHGSYFLARAAVLKLSKFYFQLTDFLKDGAPTLKNVPAFTKGKKPSDAMIQTILEKLAGPTEQDGLFAQIPPLLFKMKGPTLVFTEN